jgi:hypothetical protein
VARTARGPRKPGGSDDYQVFVSHATADKWIATVICEKIEAAGATTFRDDRDIEGGDNIPDKVLAQIRRSREMVVILTPKSVDRPWVLIEVGAALGRGRGIRIVPILYHVEIDPIPEMLKSKRAYHLNDFDSYLKGVSDRVRGGAR